VVDFQEVEFAKADPASVNRSSRVGVMSWGKLRPGWSRLVAVLDAPMRLETAQIEGRGAGGATIKLRLSEATREEFAQAVAQSDANADAPEWALPDDGGTANQAWRQTADRPLRVVLDPGHGGIDPGAVIEQSHEAAIMLGFSIELAEALRRVGMTVFLTRQTDVFVPLETRVSIARAVGADVFLSLHADTVTEGHAVGATIYKLSAKTNDAASAQLVERHDRADILAGVDLSDNDDRIAGVLMDLARQETGPRSDRLAEELVAAMSDKGLKMHRHPIQEAAFSVLKSADIPSVLLELGFMSSKADRARLADPVWRKDMQSAILSALQSWAIADAAEARLLRQ
ncbi:MAG: N-acetylmuramoyl-L-alanine amidase, partial [Albidovulum sp.]